MSEELTVYPRLKDKVVFITGASAGIGAACARHFAACGSVLVLIARRIEKLEALKVELVENFGVDVFIAPVDMTKKEEFDEFYNNLPEKYKMVDIVVNNAGLALSKVKLHEYEWDEVNVMIDTNIKGVILSIKAFVPGMIERKRGHIINIGSVAGKMSYALGSIYCATKFAVEALTTALRQELIDTPIRVSSVSPGAVETEFSIIRFHGDTEQAKKFYEGFLPLTPEDIADNVVYVASRPPHVQIADILVFPTNQSSVFHIHREIKQEEKK